MKLLLDTHVRFWSLTEDAKLPARIRKCMLEEAETSFASTVTGWEIAIKVKLGKWPEAAILLPDISTKILAAGFELLPLTLVQAERCALLTVFHVAAQARVSKQQEVVIALLASPALVLKIMRAWPFC